MSRADQDELAWKILDDAEPKPIELARGGRPLDYVEFDTWLRDGVPFTYVFSSFLHSVFAHKAMGIHFKYPSPPSLSPGWQALLAGTAEYLSDRYSSPRPAWIEEPRYILPEFWDPEEDDLGLDLSEFRAERIARTPEAFLRRRVILSARNLLTL